MKVFRIAIVGAGPAGYFAAQALQNSETDDFKFLIDIFEKLPTPWGLVRSGVAPDHPKIKSVAKVFEKIASAENVRLFANVELGKDIQISELQESYDAVVLAVGSSVGKRLGIPGEELPGSISSSEFVPWYNGHPEFANLEFDLNSDTAVVIGAGNVAMDVARTLGLDPVAFEKTDMAQHALDALKNSKIRKVHICARRAAEHASFTSAEIRELPDFETTSILISAEEINSAIQRIAASELDSKEVNNNLAAMLAIALQEESQQERSIEFHFLLTPIEIQGAGKVESVLFQVNEIVDGNIVATDKQLKIECGLVVTSIGYETAPIPGIEIENGKVRNLHGRVTENIYVVGWAERGPSGVIGTNKSDSADVMHLLIEDLREPKPASEFKATLDKRGIAYLTQTDWEAINAAEVAAGELLGKPRVKFTEIEKMLSFKQL